MPNLSDAFEEHLRGLSDSEWNDLASRVRTPEPERPASGGDQQSPSRGAKSKAGLEEARRRGYVKGGSKR